MNLTEEQKEKIERAGFDPKHLTKWNGGPYIPKGKETTVILISDGDVKIERFKNPAETARFLYNYQKKGGKALTSACLEFMTAHGKKISAQQAGRVTRREKRKKK